MWNLNSFFFGTVFRFHFLYLLQCHLCFAIIVAKDIDQHQTFASNVDEWIQITKRRRKQRRKKQFRTSFWCVCNIHLSDSFILWENVLKGHGEGFQPGIAPSDKNKDVWYSKNAYKIETCKFWKQGCYKFGNTCTWSHGKDDVYAICQCFHNWTFLVWMP